MGVLRKMELTKRQLLRIIHSLVMINNDYTDGCVGNIDEKKLLKNEEYRKNELPCYKE